MSAQAVPAPKARSPRDGGRASGLTLPLLALAGIIGAWWLATWLFDVDEFLVPAPPDVVTAFLARPGLLMEHTGVTLLETLEGFAAAVALGIPMAMAIASSRIVERTFYPLLIAINAVPKVAIAPILVVWMGFGPPPKVVMVVLLCIFPIVLSTAAGLKATPAEFVELAKSLDAGRLTTFRKFRFPYALPQIFVGLKTAISLAVIGAVISEFVGAEAGLGYLIVQSGASANTALAFVAMALLAIMSIVLFYALVAIERIVLPWAEERQ